MVSSLRLLACLALLQFLMGFAWAVQRPQGFVLLLFLGEGLSEQEVGLVSLFGLVVPMFGGPLIGLLADCTSVPKRPRLFALGVLFKALIHLAAWPALTMLRGKMRFFGVLTSISLAQIWNTNAVLTEMTIQHAGKDGFGRVRLWGGIGFAFGSFLTGLFVQWFPELGLWVVFYESSCVGILSAAVALWIGRLGHVHSTSVVMSLACTGEDHGDEVCVVPSGSNVLAGRTWTQKANFLCNWRIIAFFLIIICLGLGEGTMQSYTYVRLEQLPYGTSFVMGLSAVFMIISEVPFFYHSGMLMEKCGVMPILAIALFCMSLRQAWITFLWDARWVLPGELLHGITYSVANAAVIMHARKIAPDDCRNTFQALQDAAFSGVGMGCASWLGGVIVHCYGVPALFACSAGLSFVVMIVPAAFAICSRVGW